MFDSLVDSIVVTDVVAAIVAVGAVMILPRLASYGVRWIKRAIS